MPTWDRIFREHGYYFTENELREVFGRFEILEVSIDCTDHRCLLGSKRV